MYKYIPIYTRYACALVFIDSPHRATTSTTAAAARGAPAASVVVWCAGVARRERARVKSSYIYTHSERWAFFKESMRGRDEWPVRVIRAKDDEEEEDNGGGSLLLLLLWCADWTWWFVAGGSRALCGSTRPSATPCRRCTLDCRTISKSHIMFSRICIYTHFTTASHCILPLLRVCLPISTLSLYSALFLVA